MPQMVSVSLIVLVSDLRVLHPMPAEFLNIIPSVMMFTATLIFVESTMRNQMDVRQRNSFAILNHLLNRQIDKLR